MAVGVIMEFVYLIGNITCHLFEYTGGDVVFEYTGKGDMVYSNIHVSAHVRSIQFNTKGGVCKIEFTQIWHV